MEEIQQNIPALTPDTPVKRGPLTTTTKEKILAWLTLPLAYCYVSAFLSGGQVTTVLLSIFTVGFMVFGEILHWKEQRTSESFLWLFSELLILAVFIFGPLPLFPSAETPDSEYVLEFMRPGAVWNQGQLALFLHLFGVYWLLVRGNRLSEGQTSHMFVWDGITGFFVLPFKNFHLQAAAIISCFIPNKNNGSQKSFRLKLLFSFLAVVIGLVLLLIAIRELMAADRGFDAMISNITARFAFPPVEEFVFRVFLTVPVSAYVYGLLAGSFREEKERFVRRGDLIKRFLGFFRKVPDGVWVALIAVFSVFYILFFILQGSYLFGAFSSILPDGYTFATYAKEGFYQLLRVVVLNFALLWIAMRSSKKGGAPLKIAGTVLVLETALFDIIAFAKLFMYIHEFGFTAKRMQGAWFITVLFFAAVCILISMHANKKTARIWFILSAITLALLSLL